ncbi:SusC/RagA family TonB-linked outer membrane protein [Belliella aquatica]|uniref:SusC/RagA family TonB-linked outer membrane protein n=1 Tax=Belliella aquatica TaxID=1323734 RepID=A0ABQ1N340_9BACT|nr:SusC/RagA family TonB-linked outer membrane protein [Belliella aquatica]MCH7406619.1 SusC/RagA family TonB-linked outer membrane protein [Belliella aquatica]GGC48013.1 SusC/RagA family TonB-linked outer membrane protein [Belliella aquatica]
MRKTYKLSAAIVLLFLSVGWSFAQYTVTGIVTDSRTGEPLIGANILVRNTTTGTVADLDGRFTLNLNSNNETVLVISSLGYLSQTFTVSPSNNTLQVELKEDATNLEEVVITGLASSVKRSNLANAVSSVSAKELTGTTTIQTTDGALYGKIAGATIRSNGGAPGGGLSIQLRGISSLSGASQPLIILDGVYINNSFQRTGRAAVTGAGGANQDDGSNRLADLNPADIESIEVLKGPSAAAIYGTRANAGVIIITTKRGTEGKTKVSLSQDIGFAQPLRLLGVDDWNEEKINFFFPATNNRREIELERFRQGDKIDYEDYFYNNTALLSNTRLTVTGGTDKTKFFVSGNITSEDGTVKNTGFDRYSIRANIDHKISNNIRLGVSSNYIKSQTDRGFTGNQNNSGASIGYSIAYVPNYFDLRPVNGVYPNNPYFAENPVALTDNAVNTSEVNRFVQAFNLDIDLLKTSKSFLKANIAGGLDFLQNSTMVYLPEFLQSQAASANPGDVLIGKQESFNTNFQAALIYNWNLGSVNMNSQAGLVRLDFNNSSLFNRGRGLVPGQTNLRQANVQEINENFVSEIQEAGVFLQQEANWDDKVIGTLGIRWDKSTLNGDANKFYAFPRASLAINLANFDFFSSSFVNQLKPRIAYGETAGPVAFGSIYTPLIGANIGGLLGSVVSTQFGNEGIFPETATELEFGVDAGFFNNRIGIEATYYVKNTQNNIQNLNLSPAAGVNTTPSNEAELQNKGFELGISGTVVDKSNFRWFSRVLYWQNRVLLTRLGIPTYTAGAFGAGLGTFLYAEGFAPTTIVGTPADPSVPGGFTVWGNAQPKFNMSFYNTFSIQKNLEVSFLLDWRQGGDNINLTSFLSDGGGTTNGWFDDDNGDGIPNGRQRAPAPHNNAARWVQDASFVKVREIGIYYTVPKATVASTFGGSLENIKLGVSANNVFLFTKYEGYDPETSTFGAQSVANNVDIAPYPTPRRIFFHVTLDF